MKSSRLGCLAIVLGFVAACGTPLEPGSKPARAAAKGTEPAAEPPRESRARSIDGYKRDAARRLYFRNTTHLFDGAPPPLLKSVVVLTIRLDASGAPLRVSVIRSNGFRDLEQRAIQSVHDAAPLPVPHAALFKRGTVEYVETWLFRDDGRFQIRSLADAQASIDE